MDEQRDELRDALAGAVPPLPAGLQERAVAAMAAVPARAGHSRITPLIVGVVAMLLTFGLDPFSPLRHPPVPQGPGMGEASAATEAATEAAEVTSDGEEPTPEEKEVAPYRQRASEFVRAHYPRDADMLMAAGLLTTDPKTGLDLLKQAVSIKGSTAVWAAYVIALTEDGPGYYRAGESGIDPADPRQVAEEARMAPEMHVPDRLSEQETAPILAAIHDWERADPENAAPLVYETWYLYGLQRDAEALARWREAGRKPRFRLGYWQQGGAGARLLARMGMKRERAVYAGFFADNSFKAQSKLRTCSRIAAYEGRLAQLQGRDQDALAWWQATMGLARHAQDSADTIIQVLVANAVEGVGAGYVWRWVSDSTSGVPGGPLYRGRLYQGRAHAFYVSHAGQQSADGIRDRLVRGKLRSERLHETFSKWSLLPRWAWTIGVAAAAGILAALFLVTFAAVGTWRRPQADEATHLGWWMRLLMAVLAVLPSLAGIALAGWFAGFDESKQWLDPIVTIPAALVLALFLGLALPLIAVWTSRQSRARVVTAWRGNLRQTLPLMVAICGGLALCFGLTGKAMQIAWSNRFYTGTQNEVARAVQAIGPEWEHPRVPADAWRAEPVPE